MILTEYIKSLSLNPEKIDKIPEEQVKEILKIIIALNEEEKQ